MCPPSIRRHTMNINYVLNERKKSYIPQPLPFGIKRGRLRSHDGVCKTVGRGGLRRRKFTNEKKKHLYIVPSNGY